jgi:hypothetical protein
MAVEKALSPCLPPTCAMPLARRDASLSNDWTRRATGCHIASPDVSRSLALVGASFCERRAISTS